MSLLQRYYLLHRIVGSLRGLLTLAAERSQYGSP